MDVVCGEEPASSHTHTWFSKVRSPLKAICTVPRPGIAAASATLAACSRFLVCNLHELCLHLAVQDRGKKAGVESHSWLCTHLLRHTEQQPHHNLCASTPAYTEREVCGAAVHQCVLQCAVIGHQCCLQHSKAVRVLLAQHHIMTSQEQGILTTAQHACTSLSVPSTGACAGICTATKWSGYTLMPCLKALQQHSFQLDMCSLRAPPSKPCGLGRAE